MMTIAKHQLMEGLRDAKFIFLSVLIILSFITNGAVFSSRYQNEMNDYRDHIQETGRLMEQTCGNLQDFSIFHQLVAQPPVPMAFLAECGTSLMPNAVELNVFCRYGVKYSQHSNDLLPALPKLDWSFIVGQLMTLLAFLVSYGAISGEKKAGTLKLMLSNPVSRLKLFAGKYLGLFSVLLVCFALGVTLNLAIITASGGPQIGGEVLWLIGWAVLLSLLCISAFVLTGLAVSSLTGRPAVSLVVLLVLWVLSVFAIPGTGRLVAEQTVSIPTQAELREELEKASEEISNNAPNDAGNWNGDPFAPNIPHRAKMWTDQQISWERIHDAYLDSLVRQTATAEILSSVSPYCLLNEALQTLSGTGIWGFQNLQRNAIEYRQQLYRFVVNRDASDNTTPHLVYGSYSYYDDGVFSRKPVPYSTVPKAWNLWMESGLAKQVEWPLWQMLALLGFNLVAGLVALIALLRYDPR
jgi:ABC-type transport system involved in multi-copper enzyme maturation permease subunit